MVLRFKGKKGPSAQELRQLDEESRAAKAREGRRLKVFWPAEDAWFTGEVTSVVRMGGVTIATVLYEDGEEQPHHLGIWAHRWLDGNGEEEAWDEAAETARATAWEGLVKFDDNAELVDSKLWPGAASAGWQLKSNSGR